MAGSNVHDDAVGVEDARDRRARDEAASWYARLNSERVSNEELSTFFDWRSDTLNDAAYSRIERLTTGTRALADDPRLQRFAEQAVRRKRESQIGVTALAAALFIVSLGVGARLLFWPLGEQTYRTQVGEHRSIALSDGSRIELNTDTQVRVRLAKQDRRLSLDRGQALFAVAHDAARPFIVTADGTSVRALGTRFEVYQSPTGVQVTLAEGKVEVRQERTSAPTVVLAPGERVDVTPAGTATRQLVDVAAATGWTTGRLTFNDTRLADAVAEVNRYSRQQVVLGAGAPADLPVNGVFDAGDTGAFVAGVSTLLDLKSAPLPGGGFELTGEQAAPA